MKTNNTLRAMALSLSLTLAGSLAMAQNTSALRDRTPQERAKFQTEMMKSKLGLDSVQVKQVEAVNLKYALKNEPVMKSSDGRLSKFRQIKSSQNQKEAELKKIFTPAQFKQYEALQDEMKSQLKERRKNR
jgi:anion-transporting  ArsA/GET3 family ATPase